ncbi:SDR family oxidoreductase [Streptomyces sp. NPDC013178]|uniref:SDR family oxidoreductase n=1 Tax=Streptomyces sp. NPDC013178 TaxID=3155118 RepID=UPI0033CC8A50
MIWRAEHLADMVFWEAGHSDSAMTRRVAGRGPTVARRRAMAVSNSPGGRPRRGDGGDVRRARGRADESNTPRRAGDPSDIADVVCCLLGRSSRYVNGAVLVVDGGGRSAGWRLRSSAHSWPCRFVFGRRRRWLGGRGPPGAPAVTCPA